MLAAIVISYGFPRGVQGKTIVNITFFDEDAIKVNSHDNHPLVITVQHDNMDIKWFLIDPGSSIDVLFWDAF